ncbi:hypothetical protein SUVZ_13G2210 [Saccharomyces uvarum]|uniref:Eisosome protein SEG1 n=1 Tax=Saccharomyces uvarum TaxID=230603 RepID=A0ABN8WPM8_SACUV|nr:hypothetical protein SUVZ_13G2210 [Saccharomyces uvarum]
MFRRRTTAADMEQANPTALAAAASIGKLFMNKENQPESKPKSTYRSASMTNLRKTPASKRVSSISSKSSESMRGNGQSRPRKLNSLNQRSSVVREGASNLPARTGPQSKTGSHSRTSSLPNQRGQLSRNNSSLQRRNSKAHQRVSYDEAQRTFKDFGGPQARGVLTNKQRSSSHGSSAPLKTTRKYIPGPNGLIAVDVPVERPDNTSGSLRRSNSAHSGLNARNSSLLRRKISQDSLHSHPKRTSSVGNSSNSQTKQGNEPTQNGKSPKNRPLIETQVREETDQELKLENSSSSGSETVVNSENNLEKPKSQTNGKDDLNKLIHENIELEGFIKEEERERILKSDEEHVIVDKPVGQEKLNNKHPAVVGDRSLNSDRIDAAKEASREKSNNVPEKHYGSRAQEPEEQPKKLDRYDTSSVQRSVEKDRLENDDRNLTSDTVPSPTQNLYENSNPIQDHSIPKGINTTHETEKADSSSEELSPSSTYSTQENIDDNNDRNFDAVDKKTQEATKPNTSQENNGHKQAISTPSLAQYLRTSNTYLSPKNLPKQTEPERLLKPENPMVPATKVVTPIKSALKKSTGLSNNKNSSVYSESSPANGAYLSLTTAENTRLNAQMTVTDSVSRRTSVKRSSIKRPQSVGQFRKNRSSSPSPPEKINSKRHSAIPLGTPEKGKPKRSSVVASVPKAIPQTQDSTAVSELNGQKSKSRDEVSGKLNDTSTKRGPQAAQNNKPVTKDMNSILYPKEPPARKSSFEKTRSNVSHLGFKKLSLRNSIMEDDTSDGNSGQTNQNNANRTETAQEFFKNLGYSSRFADSDSDNDSQVFSQSPSKQTTRTEENNTNNNKKTSNGNNGAFSLFKSKNKKKEDDMAPPRIPQPNHNTVHPVTPNMKVSKKFSGVSLRAASDAEPAKVSSPTMSNRLRFSSNPENNEGRHLQSQENDDTKEKKGGLGKKLKKIFGRKR